MAAGISRLLSLLVLLSSIPGEVAWECRRTSVCSCQWDDGSIIDLEPIGLQNATPRFQDLPGPDNYYYSYNPCYNFIESADCKYVSACQRSHLGIGAKFFNLGVHSSAKFLLEDNDLILQYEGNGTDLQIRTTRIKLVCSKSDTRLIVDGEEPMKVYNFVLESPDCCPDASMFSIAKIIGSILCICALVAAVVYLVCGAFYMKFVVKETGADVIPNKVLGRTAWIGERWSVLCHQSMQVPTIVQNI
ncbi:uncharacterized protein [Ptychodera flava]|uniref:uncharacterized protein n=1 Tax=Ptychodera flava TaxID=63121 RepID=UPI00396A4EF2